MKKGVETLVDNDGILGLNEKFNIEEGLGYKNLRMTERDVADDRKQKRIFIDKELAIKSITDSGTTAAHNFRTRIGFKQYDVIIRKKQPLLTKYSFI